MTNGQSNSNNLSNDFFDKESCTGSKSVRVSIRNESNEKIHIEGPKKIEMGDDMIIQKLKPNIKIITPPSSDNDLKMVANKNTLRISKQDMFNKLSTIGFSDRNFRSISEGMKKYNNLTITHGLKLILILRKASLC